MHWFLFSQSSSFKCILTLVALIEGELIGVHCTHGLNRTGYMICRYLVEVDGWDVDTAIDRMLALISALRCIIQGCL